MATKRDYYEVLEVTRTSTGEEIKRSYRKLAVKYHPDKNPGDHTAEEKFKELGEAYDILSDEQKRSAYDRYGHQAFAQGGGAARGAGGGFHDPFDIFREVFGASGGGGGGGIFEQFFGGAAAGGGQRPDRDGKQRGSDLRYDMQIRLEEAAFGCDKEIEVSKLETCDVCNGSGAESGSRAVSCRDCGGRGQVISSRGFFQVSQTCPRCRGTGQVIERPCRKCSGEGRIEAASRIKLKIPAGIEDGSRLRSMRNGEAGLRGGPPGDLYVVVHIKEHEVFEREDSNLFCEVPVSFSVAALGGEVTVPTLDGQAQLKVPAGTQGGTSFKLRGKGVPSLNSHNRGDLIVRVAVEVPTRLNAEQRKKLEEFSALMGEENSPLHKGFFEKAKEFFG
ncbi:molecular chaperone DnaJ [Chthoniobacter flavus]|nr:molecular chaperone DnaJ [Chthoniobacter flavus]TCO93578.1 molecular chaperone DnaJ [Chthoniobacter flavus]